MNSIIKRWIAACLVSIVWLGSNTGIAGETTIVDVCPGPMVYPTCGFGCTTSIPVGTLEPISESGLIEEGRVPEGEPVEVICDGGEGTQLLQMFVLNMGKSQTFALPITCGEPDPDCPTCSHSGLHDCVKYVHFHFPLWVLEPIGDCEPNVPL